MGISDILELEQKNSDITLHKEGLFIRVYEQSAYLFVKHIKAYNLTKKFYKNVKQEVVYLGFPQSSFSKIESICNKLNLHIKQNDNQINITGVKGGYTKKEFIDWKNAITVHDNKKENIIYNSDKENKVIEKIRNFPIVNKTPIECQQFIVEMQNEING